MEQLRLECASLLSWRSVVQSCKSCSSCFPNLAGRIGKILDLTVEITQYALKGQKLLGGCVKTLLFLKNHKEGVSKLSYS